MSRVYIEADSEERNRELTSGFATRGLVKSYGQFLKDQDDCLSIRRWERISVYRAELLFAFALRDLHRQASFVRILSRARARTDDRSRETLHHGIDSLSELNVSLNGER